MTRGDSWPWVPLTMTAAAVAYILAAHLLFGQPWPWQIVARLIGG